MNINSKNIDENNLVKNARRKFTLLFEELQKMRSEDDAAELEEFIFLLETQLITIYYQRIKQNLEIISAAEPDVVHFADKKELSNIAIERLMKVLETYKHRNITLLLKCTTFSIVENK